MRAGVLTVAIAVTSTSCGGGVPYAAYQAGALSLATHSAEVAARVCGHPTPGLAAAEVTAVDARSAARASTTADDDVEVGIATAQVRGFDADGRPCAGTVRFGYGASYRAGRKFGHAWWLDQIGPWIVGATPPPRAVTPPDAVRGDTREYRREPPGPWDIDVVVPEGRALHVLAQATTPHPDDAKVDVEVRVDGAPTLHAASLLVFVSPATTVYTLRITPGAPVAVTVLAREGSADEALR